MSTTLAYRRAAAFNALHALEKRILEAWRVHCALQDFKVHARTLWLAEVELRESGQAYCALRSRLVPQL